MTDKEPQNPLLQRALNQIPWRNSSQVMTLIAVGGLVAIIIGSLYLAQATVTATTFSELVQLKATRDFFQRSNSETEAQIALRRNISTLKGRAQALGFQPAGPDQIEYIVVEGYSPLRATPTPQPPLVPTIVYDETFNGWVQQQWNALVQQFEAWMGRGRATPTPRP